MDSIPSFFLSPLVVIGLFIVIFVISIIFLNIENPLNSTVDIIALSLIVLESIFIGSYLLGLVPIRESGYLRNGDFIIEYSSFVYFYLFFYLFFKVFLLFKTKEKFQFKFPLPIVIFFIPFIFLYFFYFFISLNIILVLMGGNWNMLDGAPDHLFMVFGFTIFLFFLYQYFYCYDSINYLFKRAFIIVFLTLFLFLGLIFSVPNLIRTYECMISPTCSVDFPTYVYIYFGLLVNISFVLFLFISNIRLISKKVDISKADSPVVNIS